MLRKEEDIVLRMEEEPCVEDGGGPCVEDGEDLVLKIYDNFVLRMEEDLCAENEGGPCVQARVGGAAGRPTHPPLLIYWRNTVDLQLLARPRARK